MTKTLMTIAFFLSLTSTSVLAHHPAADIVDPETYEMIDENVADTPHADMTFDDMGSNMKAATDAMDARDEMVGRSERVEAAMETGMAGNVETAMDARRSVDDTPNTDAAMDTFTLLEDIDPATME